MGVSVDAVVIASDAIRSKWVGRRFGRLVVVEAYRVDASECRHAKALVKCDCSALVFVRRARLKSEETKSCGCLAADRVRDKHNRSRANMLL